MSHFDDLTDMCFEVTISLRAAISLQAIVPLTAPTTHTSLLIQLQLLLEKTIHRQCVGTIIKVKVQSVTLINETEMSVKYMSDCSQGCQV